MKILLINPPPRELHREEIVIPPLGLAYLAAVLEREGHDVVILDAFAQGQTWEEFEEAVKKTKADLIGIGGMTPTIDSSLRAIKICRPHTRKIVMGGPHISVHQQGFFQICPELDFGLIGEGEASFPALAKRLEAGRDPGDIPGVVSREKVSPPGHFIHELDEIPFPARHRLSNQFYRYALWPGKKVTTMITSRGCPYRCIFCDKSVFGSKWRARSPKNVLDEMEQIVKDFGIRSIIIYDDLFTLDKERAKEICQGILDRGLKFEWKCEGRVDRVDQETLSWMKKAGCVLIAYGVESGNEEGLAFLQKGINLAQIRKAFSFTREAGIRPMAYFILGIPVETYAQGMKTIEFAKELNPDYAQFSILSPYPGTKLHEEALARGWYREVEANNPFDKDQKRPVLLSENWSAGTLNAILRQAHRDFYFRPSYIWKRLRDVRGWQQMRSLWGVGCGLFHWYLNKKISP